MSSNETMNRPSVLEDLRARELLYQSTDDDTEDRPLSRLLQQKRVTFYAGFDPTASSLTVGNLVPVMLLAHVQRAGHRPIAVVGGGTGMVGDPSGKTEMRQLLTAEDVERNAASQKKQLDRYLDLDAKPSAESERGFMLNNADWLLGLNYVDFLRDVGRHFSVNRMLAAESVKLRLNDEAGLSFLEFNYSILQAYDYLVLHREYGCELQVGGSDQWGNIVAGIDLIRRADGHQAHALTAPLLTTASGQKMGKTEKGSVWLDPERTSPYDYYQFWINSDDRDVLRYLKIFTFLPLDEIETFAGVEGADLRKAKQLLAFEATRVTHGDEEAKKAQEGARALFGGGKAAANSAAVPSFSVAADALADGLPLLQLSVDAGLCDSRNAARRLARQNGLYVNGESVAEDRVVTAEDLDDGAILLRAGKKRYMRIVADG